MPWRSKLESLQSFLKSQELLCVRKEANLDEQRQLQEAETTKSGLLMLRALKSQQQELRT